jgi:hypothetical protein
VDDNYYQHEGGRKKGYDDELSKFNCKDGSTIQDGIVKERGCTDILCLLVFIAFISSMGYLTFLGSTTGDVKRILAPLDGDFKFCGDDPGFEDYPKMIITSFEANLPTEIFKTGVCVKECPATKEDSIDCKPTSTVKECKLNDPYPTTDVVGICIPAKANENIQKKWHVIKTKLQDSAAGQYANDLYLSSTSCYISIAMSVVYCLVYIYLMSAFAETIAWFCVVSLQLFLLGCTAALWMARTGGVERFSELTPDEQTAS